MHSDIRVSPLMPAGMLAQGWAEQVISILDPHIRASIIPNSATFGVSADNHLVVQFDDIENRRNGVAPTDEQITSIFQFCRPNTRVLVHCHGGISRSPAIAIALLVARGHDARESARAITTQNLFDNEGSWMIPSASLLNHMDRVIGLGGTLAQIVASVL